MRANLTSLPEENSTNLVGEDGGGLITPNNLIDGSWFASLTETPLLAWSSPNSSGQNHFEVRIIRATDSSVVVDWQIMNSSAQLTGLNLTKGEQYKFEVRAVDNSSNYSQVAQSDGWIATTLLQLAPAGTASAPVTLITGESQLFTPSGGELSHVFSAAGSGYLNTSTRIYDVPLASSPITEVISVTDSVGQIASSTIKVRAFQSKESYQLDAITPNYNSFSAVNGMATNQSGAIFAVGYSTDIYDVQHWIVRKSIDGGTTWTTVDDYNYAPLTSAAAGEYSSAASAIAIDNSGIIYVVGSASDSGGTRRWIVRKSTNEGSTWTTMNDYNYQSGKSSEASSVYVDNAGVVYVAGNGFNSSDVQRWIVRKSTDAGVNWTDLDSYYLSITKNAKAMGVTVDSSTGNIYVAGAALNSSNYWRWIVNKSDDGGIGWTTVSDYSLLAGHDAFAQNIISTGPGTLYVIGNSSNSADEPRWIIRRSLDSGVSWLTVDDYDLTAAASDNAKGFTLVKNSSGVLFAGGHSADGAGIDHWIVRKSTDNGVSWSTVRDYSGVPGNNSNAYALAADGVGNLYAGGEASFSNPHWIIQKTSDGGSNWSTVSDFNLALGQSAWAEDIATDTNGNLYSVGAASDSTYVPHWIVRKSTDGGLNWSTVDDYLLEGGQISVAAGIAIDDNGIIYVVGTGVDSSATPRWIVRKSVDAGLNWVTVNNYSLMGAGNPASATSVIVNNSGHIYVGGSAEDGSSGHWIVRTSTDGGSNWTTIEDYLPSVGNVTSLNGLVLDHLGNIYAAGYYVDNVSGVETWLVRKSTDNGTSWSTVSAFNLNISENSVATDIAVDSSGTVYVSGYGGDGTSVRWLVRKSQDGGTTWSTIDSYSYSVNGDSKANSLSLDNLGNIYVVGSVIDTGGFNHWFVRKSRDGGTSWFTIDDIGEGDHNQYSATSITPCLADRICVAGQLTTSRTRTPYLHIRILSP